MGLDFELTQKAKATTSFSSNQEAQSPVLPPTHCVTPGRFLSISGPWLAHRQNGDDNITLQGCLEA